MLEGPLEHKDVVRFFGEIDVLVVPSICEETFSFVTREAFAARVPVVGYNLGALGEAIQDEVDGLLFMPGNSEDLARKIARLADSPDLVEQLSKNILPVKTIQEYAREVIDL